MVISSVLRFQIFMLDRVWYIKKMLLKKLKILQKLKDSPVRHTTDDM